MGGLLIRGYCKVSFVHKILTRVLDELLKSIFNYSKQVW